MQPRVPVTFCPAADTVWVDPGTTIADAAKAARVLVSTPCAGRGVCGGCGVRVLSGELEPADEIELRALKRAPVGVRLACRARVSGPVEVRPLFSVLATPAAESTARRAEPAVSATLVAAVDLGTTSVAALIADAISGREVSRASTANRQAAYGADVLTRISAALGGHGTELRALAEDSAVEALRAAATLSGVDLRRVVRVVVAANSAMAALMAGADVTSLSAHPFAPPVGGDSLPADSMLRSVVAAEAEVAFVPPVAAFVGGDALAAIVAAGLVDVVAPTLLVDLGTNAELVLARPEGLLVASTAAGPAFEGVGVSCGGPASAGAVDLVRIDEGDVLLHAIGDVEPTWLSGAGVVSAIAQLRALGHIGADGAMVVEGPLESRFERDDAGVLGIRLSADGAPAIVLTQLDVRAVQLAKAAVQSGVEALMRHAGVSADALAGVFVAGAFGAALDPDDLIALGVLPRNASGRIGRVGNAALEGAASIALDAELLSLAEQTAARAVHVDLAADASFNSGFLAATELRPYEV